MSAFRIEDLPIESAMLTNALDEAQRKVGGGSLAPRWWGAVSLVGRGEPASESQVLASALGEARRKAREELAAPSFRLRSLFSPSPTSPLHTGGGVLLRHPQAAV